MSDIGTCVYISYDSFEAARIVAVLEAAGKFKKAISEHGVVINLKDGRLRGERKHG